MLGDSASAHELEAQKTELELVFAYFTSCYQHLVTSHMSGIAPSLRDIGSSWLFQ